MDIFFDTGVDPNIQDAVDVILHGTPPGMFHPMMVKSNYDGCIGLLNDHMHNNPERYQRCNSWKCIFMSLETHVNFYILGIKSHLLSLSTNAMHRETLSGSLFMAYGHPPRNITILQPTCHKDMSQKLYQTAIKTQVKPTAAKDIVQPGACGHSLCVLISTQHLVANTVMKYIKKGESVRRAVVVGEVAKHLDRPTYSIRATLTKLCQSSTLGTCTAVIDTNAYLCFSKTTGDREWYVKTIGSNES